MPKLGFSDASFFIGTALTIVLLVLDKAGKLRGPLLLALLVLAPVMMLPVVIGNAWVQDAATTQLKISRGLLMVFLVGLVYSLLAVWISTGEVPPEQYETAGAPQKAAPFAVVLDGLSMSPYPNTSNSFGVLYRDTSGPVISPVQVCAWLHIVNLQPTVSMIDGFTLEAKTVKGEWVELIRVANDSFELISVTDLAKARKIGSATLDDAVFGKELEPKKTVKGLGIFVYPREPSDAFTDQYRVSISDTAGAKIERVPLGKGTLATSLPVLPGMFDLRGINMRPWYETHPLRR